MNSFSEQDVRRHYDLLQHGQELGFTQVKAMAGQDVIGLGLFDNEEDFVSECRRYNGLGTILVGVNPRSLNLMDDYGGLKNRIRTLFMDVIEASDLDYLTGVTISDPSRLAEKARAFLGDTSTLEDGVRFFPLDEPIPLTENRDETLRRVSEFFYGAGGQEVSVDGFCRVVGTRRIPSSWYRKRTRFRKYRPYILEGISEVLGVR